MSYPKAPLKRNHLGVRLTDTENREVKRLARRSRKTVSEFVRDVVLKALGRTAPAEASSR